MSKRVKTVGMMVALLALPIGAAHAGAIPATNEVQSVQQDAVCKGVVKDATGEPVIGATVAVKGTTNATVTDFDGNFTLTGVKKGTVLTVSYIGFQTQEVTFNGQALNVVMQEDAQSLQEVVVTALGIKKDAKKLGYAVSSISSADLTKTGGSNLAAGMYGKARCAHPVCTRW